jgi:hypothetical protein
LFVCLLLGQYWVYHDVGHCGVFKNLSVLQAPEQQQKALGNSKRPKQALKTAQKYKIKNSFSICAWISGNKRQRKFRFHLVLDYIREWN